MYYPWWGDSRLGMEGKLIFSYHKLGYILQGGLSVPSIARDLVTTLLPLGAATGADPMGMLQGVSTDHWDPPPAKFCFGFVSLFPWPSLSSWPYPLRHTMNIKNPTLSSKAWCSQTPPRRARQDYWENQVTLCGIFCQRKVQGWWEVRAQLQATTQW